MHVTTSPLNRIDQHVDKSGRHGMTGTHKDEDLAKNTGPFHVVRIERRGGEQITLENKLNLVCTDDDRTQEFQNQET
jgi:hypothetical protein